MSASTNKQLPLPTSFTRVNLSRVCVVLGSYSKCQRCTCEPQTPWGRHAPAPWTRHTTRAARLVLCQLVDRFFLTSSSSQLVIAGAACAIARESEMDGAMEYVVETRDLLHFAPACSPGQGDHGNCQARPLLGDYWTPIIELHMPRLIEHAALPLSGTGTINARNLAALIA